MERPSPLPSPPERRARPAEVPTARVEPPLPDADGATAPVVPLIAPTGRGDEKIPDAAPPAEETGTGLRDVWRASRARRRALRAEVRRFTVRQRRRRRIWIGVGVSVAVMVVATVGAAYSPLFALERVDVVGTSQLDAAAVTEALSDQVGTPLALIDDSKIKAALVRFPLVESYTLEAQPPHDLVVRIVERTPIGVVQTAAGFTVVDAAGVVLSTTPQAPAGQPVLDIPAGTSSEPFRAAGRVMRALPDGIRSQVTAVSATTPDDVTLTLGATGTRVMWGSADRSPEKARVLDLLMQKSPPDSTREYDVTSPEAGVIR
ncbi:FtsQ-type POTRA domain-containing protein [Microbacterium testaceum]|uniref:Cell division protein n=1 Tax=Microbacterium testaceum TaxID=2033 RepID=A0A147F7W9_MICTE|nr:FtsQ-type POTRA domain-containing protein [Microbacterium testaceum]KTS05447.1 cell division protein [Microbacterium testaceum]KTS12158.1 cell division protein [Microbacterium testaceum]KTS82463.1 cell division protein [Microbacterium testaceum]